MVTALRTHRSAIVCALACALLGSLIGGPAEVSAHPGPQTASALAQERYYSSYGTPQPSAAALAQERYYSSYTQPAPLKQSPADSHDTPWLPIALSLAIVLTLAVASATQLRRLRTRRRAVRAVA